jgi:RecA/RadA recombinase
MANMTKPVDLSKFRKEITKSIKGLSTGFNDPKTWISTGSLMLNYLISGDFYKGVPLEGKFTMFAGESGSGKSYLCSGNLIRHAQQKGVMVVLFDSENALDEQWLERLGVDTHPDKLLRIVTSQIDTVGKTISDFVKTYRDEYGDLPEDEKPRVMFVIDSLGMLITPTEQEQFEKGDMKGDMGRKAKMLTSLCRNIVDKIADQPIGVVATNHVFASQDMFNPDAKISGGQGLEFASSIIVAIEKRKLKEDEDGNKVSEVNGIRSAVTVRKSRYAKPFEKAEIKIPYNTGMDPTSGLFDFFEKKGVLKRQGNRYLYQAQDGTEFLEFKKNFTDEMLEKMAQDFMLTSKKRHDGGTSDVLDINNSDHDDHVEE